VTKCLLARKVLRSIPAYSCQISCSIPPPARLEPLLTTLRRIQDCNPVPNEIVVHVDGGNEEIVAAVRGFNPAIRILTSSSLLGPGGSRNCLVTAAKHELVANFDDDSFPAQADYFARVLRLAERFPDAAMFSAASHAKEWESLQFQQIALPSGCGCVFRKSWFERVPGFVPVPVAYNMEEVDIGLQLHAVNGMIVHDPLLRVVHDRIPDPQISTDTNARILANTALFPYLRFPIWFWPLGVWSVCRRLQWMMQQDWTKGLRQGLQMIPGYLRQYRAYRRAVSSLTLLSWLKLKRRPKDLGDARTL
jgi:GT2 family glycosyltransferase